MSHAARAPKPVESFGPEVLQALLEGSKREIVLLLPYREAVQHRARMNSLRAAMQRSGHEMYRIVSQTTIRVVWGEDAGLDPIPEKKSSTNVRVPLSKNAPAKLIISPADKKLGEALKKAGVTVPDFNPDPVPNTGSPEATTESILADYLKEEPNVAGN